MFLEESKYFIENTNNLNTLINLLDRTDDSEIWFSSDFHIYKDKIKDEGDNLKLLKLFLLRFNSLVKSNHIFIYVGDLAYKKLGIEYDNLIIDFFSKLNGIKVLVKGNHDLKDDDFYKKMGFDFIFDEIIYKNFIITHQPVSFKFYQGIKNPINIHAHMHGTGVYCTDTEQNHFDVFYKTHNNKPINLQYIIDNIPKFNKINISESDTDAFIKKYKPILNKYKFYIDKYFIKNPQLKKMTIEELYKNQSKIVKEVEKEINDNCILSWHLSEPRNEKVYKKTTLSKKIPMKKFEHTYLLHKDFGIIIDVLNVLTNDELFSTNKFIIETYKFKFGYKVDNNGNVIYSEKLDQDKFWKNI